ncbi:chromosome transmission fidelity protein 8 [Jimgerdemannia flammicorona]|uniref:Chromosome transmission fidelity protein 8 n=1 Tax=Jimgerdemannia flammicorona TaxID=994334 RepID=A0A433Q5L4_9FUNG|nr:chromosome transmission fidelity protein 8 [Jimgerdemannia flammicorona]
MVQIIIPPPTSNHPMVMLELQGNIETNATDLQGVKLGELEFDAKGTPFLTIGHHRLEGKLVKLAKPLAVVRRRDSSAGPSTPPAIAAHVMDIDSDALLPSSPPPASSQVAREHEATNKRMIVYDVVTVLKEKYVFKQRPELLVPEEVKGANRW